MKEGSSLALANEKELIKKALGGDNIAFSTIVSYYELPLFNFISQFISVREDAEDICQESFKKAYTSLATYKPELRFSTWLFSIARNTAIDSYRKKKSQSAVNTSLPYDELPDVIDSIGSPEDSMIGEEMYESLIKTIRLLPKKYQKIAQLRFIKEYAYEEIALELEIPLNTVRTRIRRAKQIVFRLQQIPQNEPAG